MTNNETLDLIRLGIYLAKKEKFDWQELEIGSPIKIAVRAIMDEGNKTQLKTYLEGIGVWWDTEKTSPVEAIEKTMKERLATRKLRDLLKRRFGLNFAFSDSTTIDKIKPMLSNEVLKELGIEPNGETGENEQKANNR